MELVLCLDKKVVFYVLSWMGSTFSPLQLYKCTSMRVTVQCICWVVDNDDLFSHFNTLITLHMMYVMLSPLKSELDTQLTIWHFVTEMKWLMLSVWSVLNIYFFTVTSLVATGFWGTKWFVYVTRFAVCESSLVKWTVRQNFYCILVLPWLLNLMNVSTYTVCW